MSDLPPAYSWLAAVPGLPRMVREAVALHGVREVPGSGDNPEILEWAEEVGVAENYTHDEVAWCGLFMAVVAQRALKPVPALPLWALNWRRWEDPSSLPSLGDVLVLSRPGGGGHVCLYVGEDEETYHGLGGNTRDAVSIGRFERARVVGVRRPRYRLRPGGVRPVYLVAGGELSRNEE